MITRNIAAASSLAHIVMKKYASYSDSNSNNYKLWAYCIYRKVSRTFPPRFRLSPHVKGAIYNLTTLCLNGTLSCVDFMGMSCYHGGYTQTPILKLGVWRSFQVQTATSHQPFHPGLCVSLSRGGLPPVINHSTLAYVCHYPGADCHQSSTIPP